MSEAKSPNGRHKPKTMRTISEWLKIYNRVLHFQCPGMSIMPQALALFF